MIDSYISELGTPEGSDVVRNRALRKMSIDFHVTLRDNLQMYREFPSWNIGCTSQAERHGIIENTLLQNRPRLPPSTECAHTRNHNLMGIDID